MLYTILTNLPSMLCNIYISFGLFRSLKTCKYTYKDKPYSLSTLRYPQVVIQEIMPPSSIVSHVR